jgi:alkylated DNA nucleotide flippase Atl1
MTLRFTHWHRVVNRDEFTVIPEQYEHVFQRNMNFNNTMHIYLS